MIKEREMWTIRGFAILSVGMITAWLYHNDSKSKKKYEGFPQFLVENLVFALLPVIALCLDWLSFHPNTLQPIPEQIVVVTSTIVLYTANVGAGIFIAFKGLNKFEEPFSILQFARWTGEAFLGMSIAVGNLLILGGYVYVGIIAVHALAS
jgi:hypothetical protein